MRLLSSRACSIRAHVQPAAPVARRGPAQSHRQPAAPVRPVRHAWHNVRVCLYCTDCLLTPLVVYCPPQKPRLLSIDKRRISITRYHWNNYHITSRQGSSLIDSNYRITSVITDQYYNNTVYK